MQSFGRKFLRSIILTKEVIVGFILLLSEMFLLALGFHPKETQTCSLDGVLEVCIFQIPRYIVTLHELLAHTPPDHVEKNSLEHAR